MDAYKRDFIEFMLSSGVLTFGDFTTKSGRKTPYFINTGNYVRGSQIEALGRFYAEALHRAFGHGFDNLFGPAYKGIPLAVATAAACVRYHQHDVSYTFNRKEAKDHGEGGVLVGARYPKDGPGPRVVLIEDVVTAGTSVRESLPLIKAQGNAEVIGLVVSVDRMERGQGASSALQEVEQTFGLRCVSIVSMTDLIEYLNEQVATGTARFDATLIARMLDYRREYGTA